MTPWIALLAVALAGGTEPKKEYPPIPEEATVVKAYDGDTLTLENGDKVRLRWVNTPELRPAEDFGIEARDAAIAYVVNKRVKLIFDGADARDGYGRILAGIRLEDGGDLSIHLAERGLGHVFVIPPDSEDLTKLYEAQAKAKAAKLGIWSTDRYAGDLHITSFHANGRGDDRAFVNGEYLRVCNVGATTVDLSAYTLKDSDGNEWKLPKLNLPVGHTVKIHSGKGTNQGSETEQITAYLQSDDPIWDNDGDEAILVDSAGAVVDRREHVVKNRK